jgi:hypothetical protein
MITKEDVSKKIYGYLNHSISNSELVDWAENALMKEDVDEKHADIISDVLARLGVADVKNFGLLWEDCEQLLQQLGYHIRFNLEKVS